MKAKDQKEQEVMDILFPEYEFFNIQDSEPIHNVLDMHAGIDGFIKKANHLYPVALRIQEGRWDNFTIRSKTKHGNDTELKKRIEAIAENSLYPRYTIQGFFKDDKLLSCAVIKTEELYQWLKDHPNKVHSDSARKHKDDNEFNYIYWDDLDEWPDKCESLVIKLFED